MSSAPRCTRPSRFRRRRWTLAPIPLCLALLAPAAPLRADPAAPAGDPPPRPVVDTPEVTVSATRLPESVLDAPGNVTVITRDDIEASGARTLPELLRREAGLFVTNDTTSPAGFTVESRGFNNGGGNGCSTLLVVDGRREEEPDRSCPDWGLVSLANVERIEIVRGPVSAAFGDNAIGGIIQVRTRRGEPDSVRAVVDGSAGSYDTGRWSAFVGGGAGPVTASAFFERLLTDSYRRQADFDRKNSEVSLGIALGERGRVELAGGYTSTERQFPGDLSEAEEAVSRRQAEPGTDPSGETTRRRFLQGTFELELVPGLTARVLPYHRRRDKRSVLTDPFFFFDQATETDTLGLDSQLEWHGAVLGRPLRMLLGGDLRQEDIDDATAFGTPGFPAGAPQDTHARRRRWAVYLQGDLDVTDQLVASFGVRRDTARTEGRGNGLDFAVRQSVWAPRGALIWRFSEVASAYASYARGFRYPNLDEAFGSFGFAPGLAPQKSDSYEVGLKARSARASFNLAAYHMNVHDEIFFNPFEPNPIFFGFLGTNDNLDRVRHRGIEVSGSVRPLAWLEVYGSYTFDDVEIRHDDSLVVDGKRMPITPRHRGTAGLRLFLPWGFEAGLNANYVGSRYTGNDVLNARERLPRYATYDARLGWRHAFGEHLEVSAELAGFNLTGREYREVGASPNAILGPGPTGFFPAAERHYTATLQVTVRR